MPLIPKAPQHLNTKYAHKPVLTHPLSPYTQTNNQIDPFARLLDHTMQSSTQASIPGFTAEQVNGLTAHLSAIIDSKLEAFSRRLSQPVKLSARQPVIQQVTQSNQQEQDKLFYLKWLEYERSMTQPITQPAKQSAKQLATQQKKKNRNEKTRKQYKRRTLHQANTETTTEKSSNIQASSTQIKASLSSIPRQMLSRQVLSTIPRQIITQDSHSTEHITAFWPAISICAMIWSIIELSKQEKDLLERSQPNHHGHLLVKDWTVHI